MVRRPGQRHRGSWRAAQSELGRESAGQLRVVSVTVAMAADSETSVDAGTLDATNMDGGRWVTWIPDPPAAVDKRAMVLKDGSELKFKEPRVKDAMFRMGITKEELQQKGHKDFDTRGKMNGVVYSASSVRELRWKRAEQLRQKTISRLLAEIVRADEEAAARGDVEDDSASGGGTAVAMLEEQGRRMLKQEQAKARALKEATAARAAADKKLAEEAEATKELNRIKQAKILEKFEKDKADFEATGKLLPHPRTGCIYPGTSTYRFATVATVKRRKAEAQAASMARIRKKEEDLEEQVREGRRIEAARVARDAEIEKARMERQAEMQTRALAFSKKRGEKIERIIKERRDLEARMDKIGNEKERLLAERDAKIAARTAAKNEEIRKANKKKQREIRKRLKAKNKERADLETQRDADFAHKIQTVNQRLESFEKNRQQATQQKIRAKEESAEERAARLEALRKQREMAGSSNLDKAAMKAIICEQAFERKRDQCLHSAVENQARFAEKMAYIDQHRRIQQARVAAMTAESDKKAIRSQKVIDAKREVQTRPYLCSTATGSIQNGHTHLYITK